MCRSKADGGRRCRAHRTTRSDPTATLTALAHAPADQTTRRRLFGGMTSDVVLVTDADGNQAVRKSPRAGTDAADARFFADGEVLAAKVAAALNAPVAAALRDPADPDTVWVEYLDGAPYDGDRLSGSAEDITLGLLDAVIGNDDRVGNLRVRSGRLVGYDHGGAWLNVELGDTSPYLREPNAPARHFITREGTWRSDPPVDTATLARARTALAALRPDFQDAGRTAWLDYSLSVLDQIDHHAQARSVGDAAA
jgi:hypothetical protein